MFTGVKTYVYKLMLTIFSLMTTYVKSAKCSYAECRQTCNLSIQSHDEHMSPCVQTAQHALRGTDTWQTSEVDIGFLKELASALKIIVPKCCVTLNPMISTAESLKG